MLWKHDHDLYGLKIFLHTNGLHYFLVPFWNCNWKCNGMAWYRLGTVAKTGIALEPELAHRWCTQDHIKNYISPRGLYLNKGWFSLKLQGMNDKLVVGPPSVLDVHESQPSANLILQIADLAINTGVERMSKAKLWAPQPQGHTSLDIPAIEDINRLNRALREVGIVNGRPHPPRPLETIESQLQQALGVSELDSPYLQ